MNWASSRAWLVTLAGLFCCVTVVAADSPLPRASPREQRDPEEVFRDACKQLAGLEAKYDLLNGLSEVQQVVKRDENGLLTGACFKFERNAKPVGKGITARDELNGPFIHVSIKLWSGRSAQPPADLYEFEWKGQTYQMGVRVISSDTKLDKIIKQVVGESRRDAGQLQAPGVAPGTVPDRQPSPPAR